MKIAYKDIQLTDLENVVADSWATLNQSPVICFNAEMGAGKTTFIATLCRFLGVQDDVSSPTFGIINEYAYPASTGTGTIYHMDWYRLRDEAEAMAAGVEDCLLRAGSNLNVHCLIEWPEKAAGLLPAQYATVNISLTTPDTRLITVQTP
ncbi:MAG: tRNA (adenosine(37)-N6)-threonylcarbamoyltransferase complex ATPase subunit type 1 TsaE [Chitinophagia bacterium]|nr:tRNA (adenosine(37)-N6)-threonylcarbamoyltransferase complex ATPase subunit type 1 TsaE [Chitinophagia bacterium]